MTDWEANLSPIARERLARIGELTGQEKEQMVDSRKIEDLLSEFYQDRIDPDGLWRRLKVEGKPSLLREAQTRLIDSLSFGTTPAELQKRRDGILGIETLKDEPDIRALEEGLDLVDGLQRKYKSEIEQIYNSIKVEVERNPQLRVKQVQQGQRMVLVQMTVDEAIRQLPQWQDFLEQHERKYGNEFARVMERLKRELR
ncbi:MAG: hypothetical protein ACNA7X_05955 [Dehalococcoidia bacterium]